MKILVINGPNLNLLGRREPEIYGHETYRDLVAYLEKTAREEGVELEVFQSNSEGEIVTKIQEAWGCADGIVINPAAYTHTSIAILDALQAVSLPTVEVHLSDTEKREDFRKRSYIRSYVIETYQGLGFAGYAEAIKRLKKELL